MAEKRIRTKVYTVTGTIPQPMYDPAKPYYMHDAKADLGRVRPCGSKGRKTSVTSESRTVAQTLAGIFAKLFDDVTIKAHWR